MDCSVTTVPGLETGAHHTFDSLTITTPKEIYKGTAGYTYQLVWDIWDSSITNPDGTQGRFFNEYSYGWEVQEIPVAVRKEITEPVTPKPSCPVSKCPTPLSTGSISWDWQQEEFSDPVSYEWQQFGETSITQPVAEGLVTTTEFSRSLHKGINTFRVRAVQTNDLENKGPYTLVDTLLYDPDPSQLTLSVPLWVAPNSTVPIAMSIADLVDSNGALGSGIKAYTLTQEYQGTTQTLLTALGTPETFTINAQVSASIGAAPHRQQQTFTLTTVDYAGNLATLTRSATVDAQAPTLMSTTLPRWTNQSSLSVDWTIYDDGIGIQHIALAYRANGGAWSSLPSPSISGTPSSLSAANTLTNMQPDTAYELRWTLTDAFGNTRQELRTLKTDMVAPISWVIDPATDANPHPVVVLPHAWTTLVAAGNDTPKGSVLGGSGIARYEIQPVQVGSLTPEPLRPFYARNYPTPDVLRFKARPNTSYRFQIRAIDHAGNIGPWTWSPVTYQFDTGYAGYFESLLPFFRPIVSSPPPPSSNEPIRVSREPYPQPEN